MTQGEFYYLLMVIGALTVFAVVLAYGALVAPGKPHKTADVTTLPKKPGAGDAEQADSGRKEAA
jgi:hypothetical protein